MTSATYAELERLYPGELDRLMNQMLPASYDVWVAQLYLDFDTAVRELENAKNYWSSMDAPSEDLLTAFLATHLVGARWNASCETRAGGHCDLVVRLPSRNFQWIGEAKIHSDYDYLLKGLQQLLERYATARDPCAGLIIYVVKQMGVAGIVEEWRRRIEDGGLENFISSEDDSERFCFRSRHQTTGGGLEICVRHVGVVLHHKPKDAR